MANDLVPLNEKEELFIEKLIENGGHLQNAAEAAGYHRAYAYQLRKKLGKHIIEATQDYFAVNALNAASRVVNSINDKMPNMTNLNAALALLDRVGITKKDLSDQSTTIKANIFILPAKQEIVIEHDSEY